MRGAGRYFNLDETPDQALHIPSKPPARNDQWPSIFLNAPAKSLPGALPRQATNGPAAPARCAFVRNAPRAGPDALEDAGLTVLVALNGAAAIALIDRVAPDIVLMDAVMPGLEGFETCRRLKTNAANVDLPVIFMTGLNETEDVIRGFQAGGVDYVTKPVVPDELLQRIQRHLATARSVQSARSTLDLTGRFLIAVDSAGRLVRSTPQATRLL